MLFHRSTGTRKRQLHDSLLSRQSISTCRASDSIDQQRYDKAHIGFIEKSMTLVTVVWLVSLITFLQVGIHQHDLFENISDYQHQLPDGESTVNNLNNNHNTLSSRFMVKFDNAPKCNELSLEDISFTLVTHSSEDRLWMMEHHCKRWGYDNPISLAVFTNEDKYAIYSKLRSMGCKSSQISLHTIQSNVANNANNVSSSTIEGGRTIDEDSMMEYPINKLRNKALSSIRSSHGVVVDIDFWESDNLYTSLMTDNVKVELAKDPQLALVIPAFQIFRLCKENTQECDDMNIQYMPNAKEDLIGLLKRNMAHQFDPTNFGGHSTTDYYEFFRNQSELIELDCIKSQRYEPFLVIRYCESTPPYQEAFTGYGKNKVRQEERKAKEKNTTATCWRWLLENNDQSDSDSSSSIID